jgi:hypothetical protein
MQQSKLSEKNRSIPSIQSSPFLFTALKI